MKKIFTIMVASFALVALHSTSEAQIKISIPKIPKIQKEKPAESSDAKSPSLSQSAKEESGRTEYDPKAFRAFSENPTRTDVLYGFVPCYARKHNRRLKDLVIYGDYYPYPAFYRYSPLQEQAAKRRTALADLEQELKRKFSARPNTGDGPASNPAIWEEITVGRDEYIACALADFEEKSDDARVSKFQDDVKTTLQDVKDYTPQTRTALAQSGNWDWIARAISPRDRKEFLDKWQLQPKQRQGFERDLDAIAAALPPKIAAFTQDQINKFPFRNPAEVRMMRAQMTDISGMVVHKIGLYQNQWRISKDQYDLLPNSRYKQGAIYGRDPNSDHPYCRIWYVNIVQNYAGGGTYAASYAKYVGSDFVTCPNN